MNATQRVLFDHILAHSLLDYYEKTDYAARRADWEKLDSALRSQLTAEQAALLERVDEAVLWRQTAELTAMFLAAMDQFSALLGYFPRMAAK